MQAADRLLGIPRSGIRAVLERTGSPGMTDLAAGDPDFATPAHITEAAHDAMLRGMTHYTHGRGLIELRRAFAEKLRIENGILADPDQEIVVTAGALNALAATFLSVVDPGDRVIVPDPGFANYRAQIALAGGVVAPLPYRHAAGFQPDLEELERLAADARVLVLNSPGNPTGAVLNEQTLAGIADVARRHDLIVVFDEAYEHLVYGEGRHVSVAALPGMAQRTISIHSMSKSWAMTGWRIGYATGPGALIEQIAKAQEHLIGCPPTMTQWGAVAALSGPTTERDLMVEDYARRRELVLETLHRLPNVELVAPAGAFYAFPRFDLGLEGLELASAIADGAGVVTIPGTAFGSEGAAHVRISYAVPDIRLREGLDKLARWLDSPAQPVAAKGK